MCRSLRILLLLMLLCGFSTQALATIMPAVEVKLVSPFTALQPGDTYDGKLEIHCGEPGTLSQFKLEGDNWSASLAAGPATRTMQKGDVMVVEFTVDRAAPESPLKFSVDFEGRTILFDIDLSERNVRHMTEGWATKAVPDFMALPSDKSRSETYDILTAPTPVYVKDQDGPEERDADADGSRITIHISGRFGCTQPGGGFFPAHSILVEVWDLDTGGSDDLLGTTYTNYNGYYDLDVDSFDAGIFDTPDIYLRYIMTNSRIRVYEPNSGNNHVFATSVTYNYAGTNLDYGTLQPANPDAQTIVYFHSQGSRSWVHDYNLGYDVPACRIEFPSAAWPNCSTNGRIQMRQDFAWKDGVLWHEYGHWFDHEMASWEPFDYCNGVCDSNPPDNCGHCFWCQESETIAWLEGWAQIHSLAISQWTPGYYGHNALYPKEAESLGTCGGAYDVPRLTEGFIAALGLDVMDSAQDSHGVYGSYTDALAVGDASLFEVCAQDNPTGSIDFINKYIARYPAYREGFWETAANCGFQMDNTAPLMVTNLSSTSHTAGVSSPDPTVTFTWTRAYDNLSGIQGYGLYISSPSPGLPADTQDIGDVTSYTTEALSPGTYYFNIRSVDNAGNWDGDYAHWGPIVIREAEPADLTPYLPPGWDYELVPCDDDDSITSSAEVPDYLPGNTTLTYWNMRGINQGDVPTSVPFNGALNVDGEHVQSVNWGTVNAGQQYQALNIGPIMVPGGRHSFTCRHDSEDNIPETDENNNVFGRQFIWTPLTVAVNSTRGRPAPPTQTGGWNEVTSGTKWYNSDGLRMFTNEGWWHAMAVWANDNQLDVDARLHAASQGAENGFANYLGYSSNWAGELDIVVANRNMNNAASWDVGVLAYGNPGSYKAYHARSSHVSFGDSLTVALSDGEPMLLREFYLYDSQHGPVSVTAQCSTGGALHLVVMHRNYATGTATSGNIVGSAHSLDGSLIRVSGDLTETGWYGILVYGDPTDGFPARDITIEVGTTPPDLAVRLPSPWWYAPIVPRPAWDGSPTVCLLPDTLYAAPNPTYLNVAAINNGPVSSPLPSRVYRDGSYAGYVNWGTLAPGTQVTYNWDHEFIWTSGRHTLSYRVDALQEIEETNENNNIYGEQYVWGPSEMLPGAFTVRPAPPAPYNGYGDVSGSNNPFFANCDGLRLAGTGTGYWKAMAIRPEGTSDFDLRVHDPAVGSQDGYKTALFGSYGSGQVTEYILMNYNAMSLQDFDVGVTRWDGNDSYRAHAAKSSYYGNPDPSYTGLSIMANRLVAMYEFSLDDGDWSIELENLSGDDLGLAIHKDGEPFHNRYTAYGVANTNGAGGDETLVLPMVENDYYCVVVYRADDSTDRADFNLHFNAGLSPVGDDGIPQVTRLVGAYPNPFNPQTQIDFDLSRTDHAQVVIYDAQGRVIRHLVDETLRAGHHSAVWMGKDDSGRQVASGVYFARLESRSGSGLTKLVLVK